MLDLIKIGFANLRNDRSAAGALEYALLCGLIAIAIVGAVGTFGTRSVPSSPIWAPASEASVNLNRWQRDTERIWFGVPLRRFQSPGAPPQEYRQ